MDIATIRPASEADDAFILAMVERFSDFPLPNGRSRDLVNTGVRDDLTRHLDERPRHSRFFIAELDDTPAAFIHLLLVADFFGGAPTCHVSDLAVSPQFERRGLARQLLAHAEAFAATQNCTRLTLSVFPGNERAQHLYRAAGFELDLLKMGKPL